MKKAAITLTLILLFNSQAYGQSIATQNPEKHYSFGLAVEPIWLMIGGLGARVDYRLSNSVALGLGGKYIPPHRSTSSRSDDKNKTTNNDYKWTLYEIYAGPTFNLTGNYDTSGWYLTPAIGYTGAKITNYSSLNLSGSTESFLFKTLMGYQWVFKEDLRLAVGGGYQLLNQSDVVVKDESGKELLRERSSAYGGLAIDIHFGWLF